ncbi:18K peptidoglycan-associated outer membrane lipoprotein; Peptidoglycan-associated lipoprotein precursor; Outer membrane protein P6; OmpA/MotB precursor [Olavius algarvensis Delta 1 endosymbiont]|nr:18K peptidoglycan-associated outer membrane lipoprotein; Peptidoglycan-associated lipoprotein precursor; Outer membrane protein P6; OmpA/MotB precursor [Olavius algarvensis Delta 1 endosymbiont]
MKLKLTVLLMVLAMILPGLLPAAEIITEEDMIKKVVVEEDFIQTANNFLILFDSSNSMKRQYQKGSPESRYEVAKTILKEKLVRLPDLGYNAGLYLFTPYSEVYPMGPLDKGNFAQAMDSLPAEPRGPTFLARGLRSIEPKLQGLSGKTVVYIFSDGTYSKLGDFKEPEDYTQALAEKYNVCFYLIGSPQDNRAQKRLEDMAKANSCSRVIPFEKFIENPEYITGALYTVKATERIETITESKIVGLKIDSIRYAFGSAKIDMEYLNEVDALGSFLQKNPAAYVLLEGYTDNTGTEEYNLQLSLRRAESVATYLKEKYMITDDRIVMNYYGAINPAASNATAEGRRMNRRVEVAVGGL